MNCQDPSSFGETKLLELCVCILYLRLGLTGEEGEEKVMLVHRREEGLGLTPLTRRRCLLVRRPRRDRYIATYCCEWMWVLVNNN